MVGVSDILNAFMKMAEWQKVVALAERVPDLEKRLAALEAGLASGGALQGPPRYACSLCRAAMTVKSERPDPTFGRLGMKELTLACNNPACGHVTTELFDPKKRG